ncbi:MAG TPA: hypothetical protein VGI16_11490 [Candidatus Acidoferrum sp.]|jgi:hypothetical protein
MFAASFTLAEMPRQVHRQRKPARIEAGPIPPLPDARYEAAYLHRLVRTGTPIEQVRETIGYSDDVAATLRRFAEVAPRDGKPLLKVLEFRNEVLKAFDNLNSSTAS